MEVPQWLKNIWSRPQQNNYAKNLVPRNLLNSSNNKTRKNNNTRQNNTTNISPNPFNPNASPFVPRSKLNPNAPAFVPSTGGKRRKTRKSRKTLKNRSKSQRR